MDANQNLQLSKEDEAATGGDEVEVRREDQDKINKFSRLHQREILLEEELKTKHVCYRTAITSPRHRPDGLRLERERGLGRRIKRTRTCR